MSKPRSNRHQTTGLHRLSLRLAGLAVIAGALLCGGPLLADEGDGKKSPAPSFKRDGRAGDVIDTQGTVLVRPASHSRWSPLRTKDLVYPGDRVRTAFRGAHAVELTLGIGTVLMGPGTEIEVGKDHSVRLIQGDAEVKGNGKKAKPMTVTAPGGHSAAVAGTQWLSTVGRESTRVLKSLPSWVKSYRDSASNEWMGALMAKVDGRDVPLAVGYHNVTVEIRDQIARTTIEQSFINSTHRRMEGVFYFPLPPGASISGFGMWIGGELVEADIVEKQRAREIYEDILRKKKDPGLLEWEGGNLFKARVFPIEAHSEKRIRLRYTQVLPREGNSYRYRYALRSELLTRKPLRELKMTVRVMSTPTLGPIHCGTHDTTIKRLTDHEASVGYEAREYSPTQDFELRIGVDAKEAMSVIPHRRGEDGYFMVQMMPPSPVAGPWQRDLVPDGAPLNVVFVADTSGSMDPATRTKQSQFLRALVSLLGPDDRVSILAYDVSPVWITNGSLTAENEELQAALDQLDARESLGWSDIPAAIKEATAKVGEGGLVIYVGDGIGTHGNGDPVAVAADLQAAAGSSKATVHAVSPASTYEPGVLKALATIGAGSMRVLDPKPVETAAALLREAASPSLRDMRIEIDGIRTARVYPTALPNLPTGQQLLVLGRFLPSDVEQQGTVRIHGTLAGAPVTYRSAFTIPAADAGNSFLPRLWARLHLDALLEQGRSKKIREEIIEFSERFSIMTPYTSFLVLESDAQREEYGVTRRVHMRDGERFFATARDRVALEERRSALKLAGRWRQALRHSIMREIADLGRSIAYPGYTPPGPVSPTTKVRAVAWGIGERMYSASHFGGFLEDGELRGVVSRRVLVRPASMRRDGVVEPAVYGTVHDKRGALEGLNLAFETLGNSTFGVGGGGGASFKGRGGGRSSVRSANRLDSLRRASRAEYEGLPASESATAVPAGAPPAPTAARAMEALERGDRGAGADSEFDDFNADGVPDNKEEDTAEVFDRDELSELVDEARSAKKSRPRSKSRAAFGYSSSARAYSGGAPASSRPYALQEQPSQQLYRAPGTSIPSPLPYNGLGFPFLPPPPADPKPAKGDPKPSVFDAEVGKILTALERRGVLAKLDSGIHVVDIHRRYHGIRSLVGGSSHWKGWIAKGAWVLDHVRPYDSGEQRIDWFNGSHRGALHAARQLGTTRKAKPRDADAWFLPFWDMRYKNILEDFARFGLTAKIASKSEHEIVLVMGSGKEPCPATRLTIDPARNVVTEMAYVNAEGKVLSRTTYEKFVEVAGRFFETVIRRYDERERMFAESVRTIAATSRAAIDEQLARVAAASEKGLTIRTPLPTRSDAKEAVAAGSPSLEDRLTVLLQTLGAQTWDELDANWASFAKAVGPRPALRIVELAVRSHVRKNEELLALTRALVPQALASQPESAKRFLSTLLVGTCNGKIGAHEMLDLLDKLHPAMTATSDTEREEDVRLATRLAAHVLALQSTQLERAGRHREARQARAKRAALLPFDVSAQLALEGDLYGVGKREDALALLKRMVNEREPWTHAERAAIFSRWTDRLWAMRAIDALEIVARRWTQTKPIEGTPYIRHWSVLYFLQRDGEVNESVGALLTRRPNGEESKNERAQIRAAMRMALGGGWNFQTQVCPPQWRKPVADLVHHVLRANVEPFQAAWQVFADWRYRQTDERKALVKALQADTGDASWVKSASSRQLSHYISRLPWTAGAVDRAHWDTFHDGLHKRWKASEDFTVRNTLSDHILHLLDAQREETRALDFLRARLARTSEARKYSVARQLFSRLLNYSKGGSSLSDTEARENELLSLMALQLHPKATKHETQAAWAVAISQWASAAIQWRNTLAMGPGEGHKKLSRAEFKQRTRDAKKVAREQMVARMQGVRVRMPDAIRRWLDLERLTLSAELATDLPSVIKEATARFTRTWERKVELFDHIERRRLAAILTFAAVKRNAPKGYADQLLALFEKGRAEEATLLAKDKETVSLLDWPYHIFRLHVALDQPERLIAAMQSWEDMDKIESRWRVALGYTETELGRVAKGAEHFEAVHTKKELGAQELGHLARWYLVLNKDDLRRKALDARYAAMNEWQLANLVDVRANKVSRRGSGVPGELDPETFAILGTLMAKASHPNNHRWRIRNLYNSTKDFRVLGSMVTSLTGHTKERVYRFLSCLQRLVSNVHEEATCDELTRQLAELRGSSRSSVDRRAFYLLTSMVEARASRVEEKDLNHRTLALQALRAAFKEGNWETGEPLLMARYLLAQGRPGDDGIEREIVRQLRELSELPSETGITRVVLRTVYAQALWRIPDRRSRAIEVVTSAVNEGRTINARYPLGSNGVPLVAQWLTHMSRFRDAERVVQDEMGRHDDVQTRGSLKNHLWRVYIAAVRGRGAVSIGQGGALYSRTLDLLHAALERFPTELNTMASHIVSLHHAAKHATAIPQVGSALDTYARERFALVCRRTPLLQTRGMRAISQGIYKLSGADKALHYILDAYGTQPPFIKRLNLDLWSQNAWYFAKWRRECKSQSPKLWALVKADFEGMLIGTVNTRASAFWSRNNNYEWTEKHANFIQIAVATAETHGESQTTTMRCAKTLWNLRARSDAITVLASALHRGSLDDSGQWTLANWYKHESRYEEARDLGETLLERRPEQLPRYMLVAECHGALKNKEAMLRVLESAETYFRGHDDSTKNKAKLWRAEVAATLGSTAIRYMLDERGAVWMEEALRLLRERTGHRGGRSHQMANWYRELAIARARLGDTPRAVKAATAAIASTSARNRGERQAAYDGLVSVFSQSSDLPAYVNVYDKEVEETSIDSALVRQAMADAWMKKKEYENAATQLVLARELDPRDEQVLTKLLNCYDLYAVPRGSWMGVTAVWLATAVFLSVGIVTAFVDNEANDLAAEQQRTIQATVAQAVEANAEEYAPPVPSPRFPEVLFK